MLCTEYFGEKIALHCLFQQHLLQWLILSSIIGFLAWLNVAIDNNNPDAPDIPYYAAFVAVWSTLVLEFWQRKESYAAMEWGTTGWSTDITNTGVA